METDRSLFLCLCLRSPNTVSSFLLIISPIFPSSLAGQVNHKTHHLTSRQHENIIKLALYQRSGNIRSVSFIFVITYDDFTFFAFLTSMLRDELQYTKMKLIIKPKHKHMSMVHVRARPVMHFFHNYVHEKV